MPNHGSRLVSDVANQAWTEGNERHALDMMGLVRGGYADMSALMDLVEGYLGRAVEGHVCLGWSLGGHSAWQAWMGEERIDAAVVVVGCPDYMSEFGHFFGVDIHSSGAEIPSCLMSDRAKASSLDCGDTFLGSKYFPPSLINTCKTHDPKALLFGLAPTPDVLPLPPAEQARLRSVFDARIRGKSLLLCSGAEDELVPYANSRPLVRVLKDAVGGWYGDGGVVVDDRVYEGVGHRFSKGMVEDAVDFLVEAVERGPRERSKAKI
ncbi:hypothetical protein G7046_g9472 [Stylonectria norvegica]|nr:hypothetical protein G7046_g9472 [Stylonectria norvegica]